MVNPATIDAKTKPFKGIQLHYLIIFPMITQHSSFNIETVIFSEFRKRNSRHYKIDRSIFEEILKELIASKKFGSSQFIHNCSELGLPYQLSTIFEDGTTISFDGILLHACKDVYSNEFSVSEILQLTGYPETSTNAVREFMEIVKKCTTESLFFGTYFQNYYTINEIFWERTSIKRKGEPQCILLIKDPHMFSVCGDRCTQGLHFSVYLGNNAWIHEMVANDLLISHEINLISNYFFEKKGNVLQIQENIESYFETATLQHLGDIIEKYHAWDKCKKDLVSLLKIENSVNKALNYYEKIEGPMKNKCAFRNVLIQLWPTDDPPDQEERNQDPYQQFFKLEIKDDLLTVTDDPIVFPKYHDNAITLRTKLEEINKMIDGDYLKIRDVLSIFQTEFALYAVIFAFIAIIIMLIPFFFQTSLSVLNIISSITQVVSVNSTVPI